MQPLGRRRKENDRNSKRVSFAFCGSVGAGKPPEPVDENEIIFLISAFAKGRPASDPHTHLVLAGPGVHRAQLQARVNQLGLTSRVHFLGLRTDIPDVLGAADAFTCSSDHLRARAIARRQGRFYCAVGPCRAPF
ncbi:MAG: hypothetical protein DMG30_15550 [Acidobacteria bacterium]|nr:MAG: hypothetical protein DMG30_15550 [Acidobacteriota bacterium]